MLTDYFDFNECLYIKSKSDLEKIKEYAKFNPIGFVQIFDKKTKELLLQGYNKIMLPASEFMAMRMFQFSSEEFVTPTYNDYLELDGSSKTTDEEQNPPELTLNYKVFLFCMGTSGCARGSQIKYEVSNKGWIMPADLVPFKYVNLSEDLTEVQRRIYYGRKSMVDKVAYFFKRFDSHPLLNREYENGSPWTSEIYNDNSTLKANVRVSLTFNVDEDDGRDYFDNTTGINDARFNTIELLAAWPKVLDDGYTYYQDIRPFTRLNMPNKPLSSNGDSYEFRYHLYY